MKFRFGNKIYFSLIFSRILLIVRSIAQRVRWTTESITKDSITILREKWMFYFCSGNKIFIIKKPFANEDNLTREVIVHTKMYICILNKIQIMTFAINSISPWHFHQVYHCLIWFTAQRVGWTNEWSNWSRYRLGRDKHFDFDSGIRLFIAKT